jgi:hypothetical protein
MIPDLICLRKSVLSEETCLGLSTVRPALVRWHSRYVASRSRFLEDPYGSKRDGEVRRQIYGPIMVHESFPTPTESVSGCHPRRVFSVSYELTGFFHGGNTGSNPVGDAKVFQQLTISPPPLYRHKKGTIWSVNPPPLRAVVNVLAWTRRV